MIKTIQYLAEADPSRVLVALDLKAAFFLSRSSAQKSPQIIAATCVRFHAVILQEGSDHVHHISDLAIFLNRDTFEPNPAVKRL